MSSMHGLSRSFSHALLSSSLPSRLRCKGVSAGPTGQRGWAGETFGVCEGAHDRKELKQTTWGPMRGLSEGPPHPQGCTTGSGPPDTPASASLCFSPTARKPIGPAALPCGADTTTVGWSVLVLHSRAWSMMLLIRTRGYSEWIYSNRASHPNSKASVHVLGAGLPAVPRISLEHVIGWMQEAEWLCLGSGLPVHARHGGPSWHLEIIKCGTSCTQVDTALYSPGGGLSVLQPESVPKPPLPKKPQQQLSTAGPTH